MVKNPKKPFLKKKLKIINGSSGWFNMVMYIGMSYGLIHKFLEKTPSLVSFPDPSQIILKTIQLSDIKYVF